MRPLYLTICLVLITSAISAQSCCSGGVPVSGNLGFQSAEAGTWQFSLQADVNVLTSLFSERVLLEDRNRKRLTRSLFLRSAYAMSNRWSLEMFLPWVHQRRTIQALQNTTDMEQSSGIGDPVILAIFHLMRSPFTLRVGAGPQIPLGSYTKRNSRDLFLVEDLQPGSGAWDFLLFGSFEYILAFRPSLLVYVNSIVSRNGVNPNSRGGSQSYQFGHEVQLIGGISDQFLIHKTIWSPGMSLRWRSAQRDRIDSFASSSTGGKFMFVRLNNRIELTPHGGAINLQLELPLRTFVNETQLAPSFGINVGWIQTLAGKRQSLEIINR